MLYLSVRGDDDLSQMVVHGGHGLANAVQSHVHLPLHPVAVGEQTHQLHHDLHSRNDTTHSSNVSKAVTRQGHLLPTEHGLVF